MKPSVTYSKYWGSTICTASSRPRWRRSAASATASGREAVSSAREMGGRKERAGPPRRRVAAAKPDLALVVPSETHFLALIKELTKRMAEAAGFAEGVP